MLASNAQTPQGAKDDSLLLSTPEAKLKIAIRKAGYKSMAAFARQHGIETSTLRTHTTRKVPMSALMTYAQILSLPISWFLSGDDGEHISAIGISPLGFLRSNKIEITPIDRLMPNPPAPSPPTKVVIAADGESAPFASKGNTIYFEAREYKSDAAARFLGKPVIALMEHGTMQAGFLTYGELPGKFALMQFSGGYDDFTPIVWASPICFRGNTKLISG